MQSMDSNEMLVSFLKNFKTKFVAGLIFLSTFIAGATAFAENKTQDRTSPTVYLLFDGGLTTSKSEMVNSNDSGTSYSYTLGFHAGSKRNIGILFKTDSSTQAYELNDSSASTIWTDSIIRYRLSYFYLGVVIGQVKTEATRGEAEENAEIDAIGSGYGGNAGMIFGIGKLGAWYFDASSVTISETRSANTVDVEYGARTDMDTGVLFYLTKRAIDLKLGYRTRSEVIKIDGESFTDTSSTTYLGLQFNSFF